MCTNAAQRGALVLLVLCLAAASQAQAALGEQWTATTSPSNSKSAQFITPNAAGAAYEVHQVLSAEGTTIREYSDTNGRVFAVSWIGPFKPDLQQLLGAYFGAFRDAPRAVGGAANRGTQHIENAGVVVLTAGRPRAFFGRAYVPALVPAGMDAAVLP